MNNKQIRVLVAFPNKDNSELRAINDSLNEFKNIIKTRMIETVKFSKDVVILVDEDGKLKFREPNFYLAYGAYEHIADVIVGPAIFVGISRDSFRSLKEEEIREILIYLKKHKIFQDLKKARWNQIDFCDGIGNSIYDHRILKGMTAKQLADKLGVTPATISRYERGVRTPSYSMLLKLSEVLNVDILDLL